jgi:hypothetical protein
MGRHISGFADCFLHSRFRYFRLILFSSIAIVVFLSLWSLSGHPLTNNNLLSDLEVDNLFRSCHSASQDNIDSVYLGIFVPFDTSQIDLIKLKLTTWLDPDFSPCNQTSLGPETNTTDIIFFFLGDPMRHSALFAEILKTLTVNQISVKSCFNI